MSQLLEHLKAQKPDTSAYLPIEQWLRDPYYVGDDIATSLWPYWRDGVHQIFNNREKTELVFTGATGGGKSTAANICWLRFLYDLYHMKNPQRFFGINSTSKILMAYLGVSQRQAELTGFGEFRDLVDSIPFFQRDFVRNPDKDSILEFPKKITVIAGSSTMHTIGTNLISVIVDEANFFKRGGGAPGDVQQVMDIYANCRSRIRSRFLNKNTQFPGLSILVSSATHQSSFTEQIIKEDSPDTMVFTGALWDMKPPGTYQEKRFLFFVGNEHHVPQIVDCQKDLVDLGFKLDSENVEGAYDKLTEDQKRFFVQVPEDFRSEFQRYPTRALADLAGVSTTPHGKLFSSKFHYQRCVDVSRRHPFVKEQIVISLSNKTQVIEYLDQDYYFFGGRPRRAPYAPRFFHIDQSVAHDSTGLACCFIDKYIDAPSGRMPLVQLDFCIRINPPPSPDRISIEKCRRFVTDLRELGMNIGGVTMDSYQSEASLQALTSAGIVSGRLSVDRDDACWLQMIDYIYSQAFLYYDYPPFKRELFALEHDRVRKKVDHLAKNDDGSVGGKDCADACVGAFMGALRSAGVGDSDFIRQQQVIKLACESVSSLGEFDPMKALFPDMVGYSSGRGEVIPFPGMGDRGIL